MIELKSADPESSTDTIKLNAFLSPQLPDKKLSDCKTQRSSRVRKRYWVSVKFKKSLVGFK